MARILITSAIPYINGIKHLGNLVGSQLPADLFARYQRGRGNEVMFLCATDEHGTPAELAAAKAGKPVAEYCTEMHEVQVDIAARFGLSFDHFGRSSSAQNHELTQHLAVKLYENGLIEERSETQMYSPTDGRYLPDRYIEGTCPNCGFESARGDQCDNCTKQLDPVDLINPHSTISGATDLEMRETKHLYLLQSQDEGSARGMDRHPRGLAAADHLDRQEMADRWGRAAGSRHHPRPELGHPGTIRRRAVERHGRQGVLRLVRRADRVHRLRSGMGRGRQGYGLGALVAHRQGRLGRDLCAIHGQGQRAVPHPQLSRHDPRQRGAVEAGRLHQVVQLPQL